MKVVSLSEWRLQKLIALFKEMKALQEELEIAGDLEQGEADQLFKEQVEKNRLNRERIAKERLENNKATLRSYRIKP